MTSTLTTIQVKKEVLGLLKKAKDYEKQSYNELVCQMAKAYVAMKKRNQYDSFLHQVQQKKMKELWENKEDEAWEHA